MKTNAIYEALGNVDDKLITEAAASRKKRPIALIIVAAAAVAAMMLTVVGFTDNVSGNGRNKIIIGDNEAVLSFDLRAKDINIPKKYYSTVKGSSEPQPHFIGNQMDMSPSELAAEFGVELLGVNNENFSEEIEFEPNPVWNGKGELVWTYNGEPRLLVNDMSVTFSYYLKSKTLGRNVSFTTMYVTDDRYSSAGAMGNNDGKYKIIRLNDRSECYIDDHGAMFSYNGVHYGFGHWDHTKEVGGTIEDTMQILRELGLL